MKGQFWHEKWQNTRQCNFTRRLEKKVGKWHDFAIFHQDKMLNEFANIMTHNRLNQRDFRRDSFKHPLKSWLKLVFDIVAILESLCPLPHFNFLVECLNLN